MYCSPMQASSTPPSLRERKKQRIRMDLTRATVELALEQGYETTTVEQISARAEVSPRTFFRYFPAKEDVLFGDVPERLETLCRELADVGATDEPIRTVEEVLSRVVLDWTVFDDPWLEAECARLWQEEAAPRRRYIEIILEWEQAIATFLSQQWRLAPDSVRCRLTAMALISATRVALHQATGDTRGRSAATQALDEGWRLLHQGIHDSQLAQDKEAI